MTTPDSPLDIAKIEQNWVNWRASSIHHTTVEHRTTQVMAAAMLCALDIPPLLKELKRVNAELAKHASVGQLYDIAIDDWRRECDRLKANQANLRAIIADQDRVIAEQAAVVSAAKAWRASAGMGDYPSLWADGEDLVLIAAVDALTPQPAATPEVAVMSREQELKFELRTVKHDLEHVVQERDEAKAENERLQRHLAHANNNLIECPNCPGIAMLITGLTYQCPHCMCETQAPVESLTELVGPERGETTSAEEAAMCGAIRTEPGMKGFWVCSLPPTHIGAHAAMRNTIVWPRQAADLVAPAVDALGPATTGVDGTEVRGNA